MKPIIAILAALFLAGCATSPQGLEHPDYANTFHVDQGYQQTLKNIVDADTECRRGPLLPLGQTINDVQHYPDLREAKIVQGAQGVGRQIYRVVTIRESGDGTEVTVYTKQAPEKFTAQFERWANGSRDCDL